MNCLRQESIQYLKIDRDKKKLTNKHRSNNARDKCANEIEYYNICR